MPSVESARQALERAQTDLVTNTLEAYRLVMDWMERIRTLGDPALLCDAWDLLGLCHHHFGRDLESNEAFETALGFAEELADPQRICRVRKNLGVSLMQMGATHHALRSLLEALRLARQHGYVKLAAQVENNIASIHNHHGNHEAAREIFSRLLVHAQAYGLSVAIAHYNMADVLLRLEAYNLVAPHIRVGKRFATLENKQSLLPGFSCLAGILFYHRNRPNSARHCLEKGIAPSLEGEIHEEGVRAALVLARLELASGNMGTAIDRCRETISYGRSVGMLDETARAYELLVDAWKLLGDGTAAWEAAQEYALFLMEREAHELTRSCILMDMELDLLDHGRVRRKLENELSIDPLTGLESYRVMDKRVETLRQQCPEPGAMLFLDLDNLKEVNDRYGHAIGDQLILAFSRLIREQAPKNAVATRKAGDEFVLYLPGIGEAEAGLFCEHFLAQAARKRQIEDVHLPLSCSIGVALDPSGGRDAGSLTEQADLAMLQAKQLGRMRYVIANRGEA